MYRHRSVPIDGSTPVRRGLEQALGLVQEACLRIARVLAEAAMRLAPAWACGSEVGRLRAALAQQNALVRPATLFRSRSSAVARRVRHA